MEHLRTLVVDDEPHIRSAIARTLEGLQYPIADVGEMVSFDFEEAGSAEAALEIIELALPTFSMDLNCLYEWVGAGVSGK